MRSRGVQNPFKWPDLNHWWAYAKRWGTYAERRSVVAEEIEPLLDQLHRLKKSGRVDDWGGAPDEWVGLEERLAGLRQEMDAATSLDDFQDVGRRSREVIIEAVNLVFSEDLVPKAQDVPKGADAKARIDFILRAYVPGKSHEELRSLLRSALTLCQSVTHSGSISRVDAYAAAQGTVLLVRTLGEMFKEGRPSTT